MQSLLSMMMLIVYAVVEGWKKKKYLAEFFSHYPLKIQGKNGEQYLDYSRSVVGVIEMVASGKIPSKGFITGRNSILRIFENRMWQIIFK